MSASSLSSRAKSAMLDRAIARAIEGGRHQVIIDADGRTRILPCDASLAQVDDAALDAEIRELLGDGDARH